MLPASTVSNDEELRVRVEQRAGSYFPDFHGPTQARISKKTQRAYSDIYEIQLRHEHYETRRVVVKVSASARREYDELTNLWHEFALHPACAVARPLEYFEDASALVMEAVPGTSIQSIFPRLFWRERDIRSGEFACALAGDWLRLYHGFSQLRETVVINVELKLEDFRGAWDDLVNNGFPKRSGDRLLSLLMRYGKQLTGLTFPSVRVHGDFSIDNVWIHGSRVVVLDISGVNRNAAEYDLSAFLNSVLLLRFARRLSMQAFRRLGKAFLAHYSQGRPICHEAINFLQIAGIVDILTEIWNRRSPRLTGFFAQSVLRGMLEGLDGKGSVFDP